MTNADPLRHPGTRRTRQSRLPEWECCQVRRRSLRGPPSECRDRRRAHTTENARGPVPGHEGHRPAGLIGRRTRPRDAPDATGLAEHRHSTPLREPSTVAAPPTGGCRDAADTARCGYPVRLRPERDVHMAKAINPHDMRALALIDRALQDGRFSAESVAQINRAFEAARHAERRAIPPAPYWSERKAA